LINKKQIVVGTSSWGSKINLKKSLEIGNKLISIGINHFDTAPTYGAGYSHYTLNNLSKNNHVLVDTKYGEITLINLREIIKKIYRFININSFNKSFEFMRINKQIRYEKKFWEIKNIEKYLDKFKYDLGNCEIKTFYLHSPPFNILNKNYLNKFTLMMDKKKILPGISWPDYRDIKMLTTNFPNISLQISLNTFNHSKEIFLKNKKYLLLNNIFKNNTLYKKNKLDKNIINFLKLNKNYKLVIGINSCESVKSLKEILINN
jgi:aryl-alcohol dehydrogenase-like predicted oxidoreductase